VIAARVAQTQHHLSLPLSISHGIVSSATSSSTSPHHGCSCALSLPKSIATFDSKVRGPRRRRGSMDAFSIFRQGLTSVASRPPQHNYYTKPRIPAPPPLLRDDLDSDSPQRTAHTLTACCRCRQVSSRAVIFLSWHNVAVLWFGNTAF
jgi:hypothetical protein